MLEKYKLKTEELKKKKEKIIRNREIRLKELESEKNDRLCLMCRKRAIRKDGKWVKKEKKECPNRSGNNREYIEFLKNLREKDEYKDLHYLEFVSVASKEFKDRKNKD